MYLRNFSRALSAGVALASLLAAPVSWGQAEQILSELGVIGYEGTAHSVRRANLDPAAYSDWVDPDSGRDFKSFALSVRGTALVLDGTWLREFNTAGVERISETEGEGFPVNCTALNYTVQKANGQSSQDSLASCSAFTPLNDGTIRIAGQAKGRAFVVIKYDPSSGTTSLAASGTPPSIVDMDADEYAGAGGDRAGYWAIGDKKKIIFFPLENETQFEVVATINGVNLNGITPYGDDQVIAVLDTGELRTINTDSGAVGVFGQSYPPNATCALQRRAPQKFSVRGDPAGALFVGNLGCGTITAFTSAETFVVADADFHVSGLDWLSGQGGDFADCDANSEAEGCQYGAKPGQAVMWDVSTTGNSDTSFRMFQFMDLVDCRWTPDNASCPVVNCPAGSTDKTQCALNLAELLIEADTTGIFQQLAFPDGNVPQMLLPAYMRGEKCHRVSVGNSSCDDENNGYRFHTFFAITDAIFTGNFYTDYKIDEFRTEPSYDPCDIPDPQSTAATVNETANLIVYNSDSFDTVSSAENGRGGVIINDACNGRAGGFKWSAQSIGLELYDENEDAYVKQGKRMMAELKDAGTELVCPILMTGSDCSKVEGELVQMQQKLHTCLDALYKPLTGNSAENCSAFYTKVQNLQNVLSAAVWPDPAVPGDLELLKPNYEGEFRARLSTLLFFLESYILNSVPPDGIEP